MLVVAVISVDAYPFLVLSELTCNLLDSVKWGDFDQQGEFDHLKLRLSFSYLFTSKLCLLIE